MATSSGFIVKVNGVQIKNPSNFKLDMNYISDSERVLNSDMLIDGLSGKIKLVLTYDRISLDDFKNILGMTWNAYLRNKQKIKQKVTVQFWEETPIEFESYIAPHSVQGDSESMTRREFKGFKLEFTETTGETFIFD